MKRLFTAAIGSLMWAMVVLCIAGVAARAAEVIPEKPVRYFNDYAHVVPPATAEQLNQKLESFERETSDQVVVVVYPKMQSDSDINDYCQRVAQKWQVGQKERNNGVVLFVFTQDRKMSIQVGYGLEGAFPDIATKRVQEEAIVPFFKRGDYAGGLVSGVDAILQQIRGEYKGTGRTVNDRRTRSPVGGFLPLIFIVIVLFIIIGSRRRGTVYSRGGRYYGSGWGGWGGGSGWGGGGGWSGGSSGGGFSSGGGSFGGGGSSSSW
jgi:uncharacterized protein